MIRFAVIAWFTAAVLVTGFLFHVKYEVQRLEQELRTTQQQILEEQETIQVLQAEWSYLNRPERLARLAERHLSLDKTDPKRLASFAILPDRPENMGGQAILVALPGQPAPLPIAKPTSKTGTLLAAAKPAPAPAATSNGAREGAHSSTNKRPSAPTRTLVAAAKPALPKPEFNDLPLAVTRTLASLDLN